jgi:DNA helicase-2/ATP-dependent DNA helicase PcrA
LWTKQKGGRLPEVRKYDDQLAEAKAVLQEIRTHQTNGMSLDDIAVLYRTNRCPTLLEIELLRAKVPYKKYGGQNFNEASHVKDMVSHLRAITNPRDAQACFRALKLCTKIGIVTAQKIIEQPGAKLTERIFSYSDAPGPSLTALKDLLGNLEYTKDPVAAVDRVTRYYLDLPSSRNSEKRERIEADCAALVGVAGSYKTVRSLVSDLTLNTDSDKKKKVKDHLTLSTVHSAKGLEWPVVFLIHAFDGRLPKTNQEGEGDIEEELRVAYVAVTRPHRKLVISYPATIRLYKQRIPCRLSRFLEEAKDELYELQDKTDPYKVYREREQRRQANRRRFRY